MSADERAPSRPAPAAAPALRPAVCVLLEDDAGRCLFVRRAPGRPAAGYWTPVTGKIEDGESIAEAAVREVFEETGLFIKIPDETILTRSKTEGDGVGFELFWIRAVLADRHERPQQTISLSNEVAEARWVSRTELATLAPMFASTRAFFR
jgi:8-oxo-dGTP diphosphatase